MKVKANKSNQADRFYVIIQRKKGLNCTCTSVHENAPDAIEEGQRIATDLNIIFENNTGE